VSNHPPVLISLNNGPFGIATDFYPLTVGKYLITLQDANGCEWQSDTIKIGQPPLLTASLGADFTIRLGDTAKILANVSVPLSAVDTVYWTPLLDTLNAGTYYQAFVPFLTKQITMRVVDTNGCAVSDRVTITVKQTQNVYVPNIIKPDSDVNNVLTVFGGPEVQTIESLQIYDRWGSLVFEIKEIDIDNSNEGWDGRTGGINVAPGVYLYTIELEYIDGRKEWVTGDVLVVSQ
jgi:gliding motility-associated-like protein